MEKEKQSVDIFRVIMGVAVSVMSAITLKTYDNTQDTGVALAEIKVAQIYNMASNDKINLLLEKYNLDTMTKDIQRNAKLIEKLEHDYFKQKPGG